MSTAPQPEAGRSITVTEQQLPPHEMLFAGTTVCSGFRYSVIRIIGGNMRNPMPVERGVIRHLRSLRDD
jgi:hypothetical protein